MDFRVIIDNTGAYRYTFSRIHRERTPMSDEESDSTGDYHNRMTGTLLKHIICLCYREDTGYAFSISRRQFYQKTNFVSEDVTKQRLVFIDYGA